MHDVPKYKVRPKPERLLADKFLTLMFLGLLLYIAIFVNYYILGLEVPELLDLLFISGIIILMALELILCYVRYGNYSYDFYAHKIELHAGKTKTIKYSDVDHIEYTYNIIDKLMHTGSLEMTLSGGKKIRLKSLHNPNQAFLYLQKSIKGSRL